MTKVSILVPTNNRYIFLPQLIRNIEYQDYPKKLTEVIIADDSNISIKKYLPSKYKFIRYEKKVTISKKRQDLKEMASGEILICMDDDDYYPPTRVSYSVSMFNKYKHLDFAYCPKFICLFKDKPNIYLSGPWTKNWGHATFAFRKKYANTHNYNINKFYGEEREFTNYYKIPFINLDPEKSIIVYIHNFNSIPKNNLGKLTPCHFQLQNLIKDQQSFFFYLSLKYRSMGPIKI